MSIRISGSGRSSRLGCLLAAMLSWTLAAGADTTDHDSGRFPYVSGAYSYLPAADFATAGTGGKMQGKETRLVIGAWRFEEGGFRLDLGLDYQYNHYAYENIESRNRDLHRLQLPIGLGYRGDGWDLTGFVAPGVATSSNVFKDLVDRGSSDDFVVTGRLEAHVPRNPDFSWLGGVAFDRSFGEDRAYPVLGLHYRPGDRLGLRLAFPDSSLVYRASERQRLSMQLFPAGYAWHVVSDDFSDDFDYELEAIRLQGTWSWRFTDSLALDLSVGYEFDRHHRFVDDAGRTVDSALGSQFLAVLGLRWGNGPLPVTNHVARYDRSYFPAPLESAR